MGVRVRLTRNSTAYLPFWVAIPVGLYLVVVTVVMKIAVSIVRLVAWAVRAARKRVRNIERN